MESNLGFTQHIANIESLYKSEMIQDFQNELQEIDNSLTKSIFIPTSADFSPIAIEMTLTRIVPMRECGNVEILHFIDKFTEKWFQIANTFCPMTLLEIIKKIFDKIIKPRTAAFLFKWCVNIFETFNKIEKLKHLDFVKSLLLSSKPDLLVSIPDHFWIFLRDNSNEGELFGYIHMFLFPSLAHICTILSANATEILIPPVLETAPFEFVCNFLRELPRNAVFNNFIYYLKLFPVLKDEKSAEFQIALATFSEYFKFFHDPPEDTMVEIKAFVEKTCELIKDNSLMQSLQELYGQIIITAALKSLVPISNFNEYLKEWKTDELQNSLLEIVDLKLNELNKDLVLPFLLDVASKQNSIQYLSLMKLLVTNYQKYHDYDESNFIHLLRVLSHPLPIRVEQQEYLAKLLIQVPISDFNLLNLDKYIVLEKLSVNPSIEVTNALKQFVRIHRMRLDYTKMNWFGDYTHSNIILLTEHDPILILELLSYHIFKPDFLHIPISTLSLYKDITGPLAFHFIASHLYKALKIMGVDLDTELSQYNLAFRNDEVLWIDEDAFESLYTRLEDPIVGSTFGSIIESFLHAIKELRTSTQVSPPLLVVLMQFCRYFAPYYPEITSEQIAILKNEFESATNLMDDSLRLCESDCISKWFMQYLPTKYADVYVKAGIKIFGPDLALKNNKELVYAGISISPELAKLYSGILQQPIPQFPTFLYFTQEQHADWVKECHSSFKFNDWIIDYEDLNLISDLPEITDLLTLDQYHRRIYNKIKNDIEEPQQEEAKTTEEIETEEQIQERHFDLHEVQVKEGLQIRKYEPPTYFNVISFLWHSSDKLPSNISPSDLESFALSNVDDSRITAGFLSYARTHNMEIQIQKWAENLKITQNDLSLFAASQFLSFIKGKYSELADYVENFISASLETIGVYSSSVESLIAAFIREKGMKWIFIRSIIGIDPDSFATKLPLIQASFTDIEHFSEILSSLFISLDTNVNDETFALCASTISSTILFNKSDFHLTRLLPSNCQLNQRLLTITDFTQMQPQFVLPSPVLDALTNTILKAKKISESMMAIYSNLAIDPAKYKHYIVQLFPLLPRSRDFIRYFLVRSHEIFDIDVVIQKYIGNKPPSFVRSFFRAFRRHKTKQFTEGHYVTIKQSIVNLLDEKKDQTIYPELCYSQLGKIGMKPWNKNHILLNLKLGYIDTMTIMGAFTEMSMPNIESLAYLKYLVSIDEAALKRHTAWETQHHAHSEFANQILQTATSENSNLVFADMVIKTLSSTMAIKVVGDIVLSQRFVNCKNFPCVALVFRKLEALLVKFVQEEMLHKSVAYHNKKHKLFYSSEKADLFYNPDDEETISKILHKPIDSYEDDLSEKPAGPEKPPTEAANTSEEPVKEEKKESNE